MWLNHTNQDKSDPYKHNKGRFNLTTATTGVLALQIALSGCTDSTANKLGIEEATPSYAATIGSFVVNSYNVHDLKLKTKAGKQDTLNYINYLVADPNTVTALQEVRGIAKARWLKASLEACDNPDICELNMFMPDDDGSSMPWIWHNDRFDLIAEESMSHKLHDEQSPKNENGNKIKINQKWITVIVLKDKISGGKVALINIHLVRDYQTKNGKLNTKAPEILDIYYDEMKQIEAISKHYLDLGYSVIIAGDTNNNHNQIDMPNSPAKKLGEIGFANIYHDNNIQDLTPNLQNTHHDILTDDDSGNIDAIYLANPNKPAQPFELKIVWRKNLGPAPSDHSAISAGITAINH